MNYQDFLVEHFLRYAAIASQSIAGTGVIPSSEGQWTLGRLLCDELKALGLINIDQDEHGVVTALLPGTRPAAKLGFCSHLDTVNVSLSPEVKPQIIDYQGGDVVLNAKEHIVMSAAEHPELKAYQGQKIIFSDGTSVLGADNKAAMANIMAALQIIVEEQRPHGDLYVAFVPDEEIGLCGSKVLDLNKFKPDYAYTIDSCALGEVVYETFNAGSVYFEIEGVTAHPMSAKDNLVNPILVAHDLISLFDRLQTPEHTAEKDGYWWFNAVKADALTCSLTMHIRDFDKANYLKRKEFTQQAVEQVKRLHPKAKITVRFEDVYENIANNASPADAPIAKLYQALSALGIEARTYAMRGGTDGSCLSARGIVTPNYFTGAHNFHSRFEFLPLESFEKSLQVTLKLIELA